MTASSRVRHERHLRDENGLLLTALALAAPFTFSPLLITQKTNGLDSNVSFIFAFSESLTVFYKASAL